MKITIILTLLALSGCSSASLNQSVSAIMYSTQPAPDHYEYSGPWQFQIGSTQK